MSWQAGVILRPRQRCGAPVTARKMTTGETATRRGEHSLPERRPPGAGNIHCRKYCLQQKDYRKDNPRKDNHRMRLRASTRISWTRNRCCDQFDGHKMRLNSILHILWPSFLRKLPPSFEPTFFLFRREQIDFGNPLTNNDLSKKSSQPTTKPTSGKNVFLPRREQIDFGNPLTNNDLSKKSSQPTTKPTSGQNVFLPRREQIDFGNPLTNNGLSGELP